MRIREFGVEIWMNAHENHCRFNLAETCVSSLSVGELLALSGRNGLPEELAAMRLTYGAIEGSQRLRSAIAALYETRTPDDVMIAHGASGANALVYQALVEPGDLVISFVPTYQQHHSIPESLGAEVVELKLRRENGYLPDISELSALATPGTKIIALTNPNNPTGSLIEEPMLREIASIAKACGAYVLCDEVYRGLDQEGAGTTASMADLYEKGISVGSMSKAWSLAGLRLGWVTGPAEVLSAVSIHRDYNTISVGMIDDLLAAIALEAREKILARSRAITRGNLDILSEWVEGEPAIDWVRPSSGTTTLLHYGFEMPSAEFCSRLLEETGVFFVPGSAMDLEHCVRIGFANDPEVLRAGLPEVSRFLKGL
jgi:aspartate/methionine/tyrosine aminotransferase